MGRPLRWLLVSSTLCALQIGRAAFAAPPLDRTADPIVLTGASIPALGGAAPARIVGFRWMAGWDQVPVQVDERALMDLNQPFSVYACAGSSYCFSQPPNGASALQYTDSATFTGADPNPILDADDEVVFMAKDTGVQAPAASAPPGVVPGSRVEIRISDPLDGGEGWIYLFEHTGALDPGAGETYVTYDFDLLSGPYLGTYQRSQGPNPEESTVATPFYERHFSDRWRDDGLAITAGAATGVDVLDRHKVLVSGLGCVRSEDTLDAGEGCFVANKSGPVRGIRSYMGANSGPHTQRQHLFYERREDVQTFVRVHSLPGVAFFLDYDPAAAGMVYRNDLNPAGVTIDGVPDAVSNGAFTWETVDGAQGGLTMLALIDTDIPGFAYTSTYLDDAGTGGCTGDAFSYGSSGLSTSSLPSTDTAVGGTNHLTTTSIRYFEAPGEADGPSRRLQLDNPLVVTVMTGTPPPVTLYVGSADAAFVDPAFAAATSGNTTQLIDFDDDGFSDVPQAHTPIPTDHYLGLGVRLHGLEARSMGTTPWTHSLPIGAQASGYNTPQYTGSYSVEFTIPVASVGLFANDVEGSGIAVTVHTSGGAPQAFLLPRPQPSGAVVTNFYGFTAPRNVITRIDFSTPDLHIIDDLEFGLCPDTDADGTCDGQDNCPAEPNADQRNSDLDPAGDVCDVCPSDPANQCDPLQSAADVFGPSGGVLTTPDGRVGLDVPAGAVASDTTFSITGGIPESAFGAGSTAKNLVTVVNLEPEGIVLSVPATLTFAWRDDDQDGTVDGTVIREENLHLYRNGAVVPGTSRCGAQTCTPAACCDATANTWAVQVTEFSEWALGSLPCVSLDTSKLTLKKIGAPAGDDKLQFKGSVTLTGVGSVASQLDLVNDGAVVRLVDGATVVLEAVLPGGAYDGETKTGWRANAADTKWQFVGPKVGAPGGITMASFQDKSGVAPGQVKFVIKGSAGSYAATTDVDPAVVLPESGQCYEATYPATAPSTPSCTASGNSTIKCKT